MSQGDIRQRKAKPNREKTEQDTHVLSVVFPLARVAFYFSAGLWSAARYCRSITAKTSSPFYCIADKLEQAAGWLISTSVAWLLPWLQSIEIWDGSSPEAFWAKTNPTHSSVLRTYSATMPQKEPCVVFQSLLTWCHSLKSCSQIQ